MNTKTNRIQFVPWIDKFLTPKNSKPQAKLRFGQVEMNLFDILRVPVMYIYAFVFKQKITIQLSATARYLYVGLLFLITVVALALPSVAEFFALVACSVGFYVGIDGLYTVLSHKKEGGHHIAPIIDRSTALILGTLTLTGLIIMRHLPATGFWIMVSGASFVIDYVLVRIAIPICRFIWGCVKATK